MSFKVYTAGAIEHLNVVDAVGWRTDLEALLNGFEIEWLHPTRRAPLHQSKPTYNRSHRIVAQDLRDLKNSDLIVFNLADSSAGDKKWGTCMELALCWEWKKPTIVLVDEGQFKHPFVYTMATEVYYTLEDIANAVADYVE